MEKNMFFNRTRLVFSNKVDKLSQRTFFSALEKLEERPECESISWTSQEEADRWLDLEAAVEGDLLERTIAPFIAQGMFLPTSWTRISDNDEEDLVMITNVQELALFAQLHEPGNFKGVWRRGNGGDARFATADNEQVTSEQIRACLHTIEIDGCGHSNRLAELMPRAVCAKDDALIFMPRHNDIELALALGRIADVVEWDGECYLLEWSENC